MELQQRRWLKRDRYSTEPIRLIQSEQNPAISRSSMRRFGARRRERVGINMMFGEDGFSDDGPHTARANDLQSRCDQMSYEDNQMTHEQSYQSLKAGILG